MKRAAIRRGDVSCSDDLIGKQTHVRPWIERSNLFGLCNRVAADKPEAIKVDHDGGQSRLQWVNHD
jgi:hypothetical protein